MELLHLKHFMLGAISFVWAPLSCFVRFSFKFLVKAAPCLRMPITNCQDGAVMSLQQADVCQGSG